MPITKDPFRVAQAQTSRRTVVAEMLTLLLLASGKLVLHNSPYLGALRLAYGWKRSWPLSTRSGKSLWSWASKAREAVTKAADEVASSFTNTNWGQELADFKSGLFSEAAADARALRCAASDMDEVSQCRYPTPRPMLSATFKTFPTCRLSRAGLSTCDYACREAVSSNQLQERSKAALAAAKEQSQKILKSMESNPFMNQLVDASTSFAKMATSFVEQSRRTVETIIDDAVRESTAQEGASGNAGGQTAALTAMQQDPRCLTPRPLPLSPHPHMLLCHPCSSTAPLGSAPTLATPPTQDVPRGPGRPRLSCVPCLLRYDIPGRGHRDAPG